MGRKSSEVSIGERKVIYKLHIEGKYYLQIANLVNKSKSTIQYAIKNIKTNGDVIAITA